MPTSKTIGKNPGFLLQELLFKMFPLDSKPSFLTQMDDILRTDGEFSQLVYQSCINYMVRRLITTAEFKLRYCEEQWPADPRSKFIIQLRKFLIEDLHITNVKQREQIIAFLNDSVNTSRKRPSDSNKRSVRDHAKRHGLYCYICGEEMDFDRADVVNSAELEHLWPRALGGSNADFNYMAACSRCNKKKDDYIDASDHHYEEICLVIDEDHVEFEDTLSWRYRMALYAKSNYRCYRCDKPASRVGKMRFVRRNRNDSWHFLNIDAYCENCSSRM